MDKKTRNMALEIESHECTRCHKFIQQRKPVNWCNKCLNEAYGKFLDKEGLGRYNEDNLIPVS